MDLKVLLRTYYWPVLLATVNGFFLWLSQTHPTVFGLLQEAGIGPLWVVTGLGVLMGYMMTRWNPTAGKDQVRLVPKSKHGESPSLKKPGR